MKPAPSFDDVIAAGQRAEAARLVAESEHATALEAARIRMATVARHTLYNVVLPVLEAARQSLENAGIGGEVGNGWEPGGRLRYSLRLVVPDRFPPALVFTVTHTGPRPHIGHHTELAAGPLDSLPEPLYEVTTEAVEAIVREFLTQAIR